MSVIGVSHYGLERDWNADIRALKAAGTISLPSKAEYSIATLEERQNGLIFALCLYAVTYPGYNIGTPKGH